MNKPISRRRAAYWRILGGLIVLGAFVFNACSSANTPAMDLAAAAGPAPRALRVVMDNNYPPYTFLDEDGNLQGILIDQWDLWSAKTGVPVEITGTDWSEALRRMEAGEFDVIDTIFVNQRRRAIYDFSAPYATIDVPIFFNKNISGIVDARSLSGFRVAVKAGDAAIDYLQSQGVNNLWGFSSYEAIVDAAKEGSVVVFVMDKPPAQYLLYKMGLQNDFNITAPLYSGQFHRAVLKGNTETLRLVEDGFAQIDPADLGEIEQRWFGSTSANAAYLGWLALVVGAGLVVVLVLATSNWALQKMVGQRTNQLVDAMSHLSESEERFRLIFNLVNDAIFVHSLEDGKIVDVNQRSCEMYGYLREELCALSIETISAGYPPYGQKEALGWIAKAVEGEPQIFEWLARRQDGSLFWVEVNMSKGSIGGQERIIVTVRDISERRQSQQALVKSNLQLALAYDATLEGWSTALELRERGTAGHSERVVELALHLAQVMGVQGDALVNFRRGVVLHDIGKMGVPDNILLKPGPLSADEWVLMRQHPIYAHQLLSGIDYLRPCLDVPYCHHERWDGSGYPRGLKGEAIPLAARIFAVVDVWDALTSDRPYRPAWSKQSTVEYLRAQAGVHFDPKVVKAFLGLVGER
jgi:PAS domain S-box-containing protein